MKSKIQFRANNKEPPATLRICPGKLFLLVFNL